MLRRGVSKGVDHSYAVIFLIIPLLAYMFNADSRNVYLQFVREGAFAGCTTHPRLDELIHTGATPAHMLIAFICVEIKWATTLALSPIINHVALFYDADTDTSDDLANSG
jgi:hypothetical protein